MTNATRKLQDASGEDGSRSKGRRVVVALVNVSACNDWEHPNPCVACCFDDVDGLVFCCCQDDVHRTVAPQHENRYANRADGRSSGSHHCVLACALDREVGQQQGAQR